MAWGGEVIQGHSGLHLNLLIPDDSLYCLIAKLMTSVGMGWGGGGSRDGEALLCKGSQI